MPEQDHTRPFFMVEEPRGRKGTPGFIHRRRSEEDVADRDLYLTPLKLWRWFWERFEPMRGTVITDPSTAGINGWCAGGQWAAMHGRDTELADLHPLASRCRATGAPILEADYLLTPPRADGRRRTHLTNGPFKLYPRWWKKAMRECDEVILVVRAGLLATCKGRFREGLHSYWQPAGRIAFEISAEEGLRRLQVNAELERALRAGRISAEERDRLRLDVVCDDDTVTGYRCSHSGTDHGLAVWRRGYTGTPAFMLEAFETDEGQGLLFDGPRKQKRISSEMRLGWR